jgi:hypothetical protein
LLTGVISHMIVSTPVLPRDKIGDLIRASPALSESECVQPPTFRYIGRDKWWTPLRYARVGHQTLPPYR